ncbi:MAG: hypothetical protein R3E01_09040 [Pirellulaceae bacterium]
MLVSEGCGRDRPRTVKIDGRVTLDQGDWPASGEILFLPVEPAAGYPRHNAVAKFATDGAFDRVTTWEEGDGIVPGTYRIAITCWKTPPQFNGPPPVSWVDQRYIAGSTSDKEVEITIESSGESFVWDFPGNKSLRK